MANKQAIAMTDKMRDDMERLIYRVMTHASVDRQEALRFVVRAAMGELDAIELLEATHVQ